MDFKNRLCTVIASRHHGHPELCLAKLTVHSDDQEFEPLFKIKV